MTASKQNVDAQQPVSGDYSDMSQLAKRISIINPRTVRGYQHLIVDNPAVLDSLTTGVWFCDVMHDPECALMNDPRAQDCDCFPDIALVERLEFCAGPDAAGMAIIEMPGERRV